MTDREPPLQLIIPLPSELVRAHGRNSTTGPLACFIQYRGIEPEREKIKKAAAICGVSYGSFMRSVVNDAADLVINAVEGSDNNNERESNHGTTGVDT